MFLVLPFALAIAADAILGMWPILTIVAVVLVFPVAGFVIIRKVLSEMERVIRIVAPAVPVEQDGTTSAVPPEAVMDVPSREAHIAD